MRFASGDGVTEGAGVGNLVVLGGSRGSGAAMGSLAGVTRIVARWIGRSGRAIRAALHHRHYVRIGPVLKREKSVYGREVIA